MTRRSMVALAPEAAEIAALLAAVMPGAAAANRVAPTLGRYLLSVDWTFVPPPAPPPADTLGGWLLRAAWDRAPAAPPPTRAGSVAAVMDHFHWQ